MSEAPQRLHLHGRRVGRRLRPGQQRLMAELLPQLAVPLPSDGAQLDPATLFEPRPSAVWLEVGFGSGEHLAEQAAAHPEVGFIGCEIFRNGVAGLLGEVERRGLRNVRIHADDARPLLEALEPGSIARAFLLFPDPWPKARHAERRFVSPANLDRFARLLREGAELRIASDDPGQIAWILEQTMPHPAFERLAQGAEDLGQRPTDWPATRYERKAVAQGRQPAFFRFRRRVGASLSVPG